jgi:hypothetical protein
VAYKRDCFTVDILCVGIATNEVFFETNEEMEGWDTMIESLPNYLPGTPSKDSWWECVTKPSFATNWTPLWSKEGLKEGGNGPTE